MTGNEYQKECLRTAPVQSSTLLMLNGVMGMAGESGECVDLMKKVIFQGHELDREHLAKEVGDVAWYVAVTAHALGYSLDEVFQMNVDKLRARYPEGFDVEKSVHRKDGDI